MDRVLVAYGSRYGSTAGVADAIGLVRTPALKTEPPRAPQAVRRATGPAATVG
jgi:hypothetical protein